MKKEMRMKRRDGEMEGWRENWNWMGKRKRDRVMETKRGGETASLSCLAL